VPSTFWVTAWETPCTCSPTDP